MPKAKILISDQTRLVTSDNYNMMFSIKDGNMMRWGKKFTDDPEFCPFGPEIADIEISEICHGVNGKPCKFCYKGNTGNKGKNMSFETFRKILDKLPQTVTQVALGIGDIDSNPDIWKIMEYCREKRVVPNITINGWNLTDEYAEKLKQFCGAVAISRYDPPDVCYDAVKKLTDIGMEQINIHMMVSEETYPACIEVMDHYRVDSRLEKLNAIVYLMLKPKGRGEHFTKISEENYKYLISKGMDQKIPMGFDSCSAASFQRSILNKPYYDSMVQMIDSCESTLFSAYINVDGKFFPCSFTEGIEGYDGIDVLECEDFLKNIWYAEETKKFRGSLINNKCGQTHCRKCPIYDLDLEQ